MADARIIPGVNRHVAVAELPTERRAAEVPAVSPGVERYVAAAQEAACRRAADRAAIRKCRFDTIAVNGLYTVAEALDFNQASVG